MFPEITRDDIFRLETERLWLRWPRAADAQAIADYCNDPEVALNTGHIPYPYTLRDAENFIRLARSANGGGGALFLALTPKRRQDHVIGVVSLIGADHRGAGDLGYALAQHAWNQGFMTEAAASFVDLIFKITSVDHIVSAAMPQNRSSLRLQEKLGFVVVGEEARHAPARGGPITVTRSVLKRGAAHTSFGARRPKLVSS